MVTAPSPLLAVSTERLAAELRRHIGAHADIVANDLLASDVVRTVDLAPFESVAGDWLNGAAHDLARLDGYESSRVKVIRALAAALEDR